jgi:hypothetical protein
VFAALAFGAAGHHICGARGPDQESDMSAKGQQTLKAKMEDKLDQALEDSFPASDPVSFIEPGPAKDGGGKSPATKPAARGKASRKAKGKATRS